MISTHYAIVAFSLVVFTLIASPSSQSLMSYRAATTGKAPKALLILGFNTLGQTTGQKNLGKNIGPCLAQICRGVPDCQRSVKSILQLAARVNSSKPTKQYQTMIRCVQNKHGVSCSLFTFQASDKTGGASSKSKISTYFAFRISLVNITVMLACTSIISR